jgi:phasin family protein
LDCREAVDILPSRCSAAIHRAWQSTIHRSIHPQEINMALSLPSSPEQVVAAQKASFDTAFSVFNNALDSAEKLASLNISSARTALEDQISGAKSLLGAKDLHEVLSVQSSLLQPQIEKSIAYARRVYEISSEVQEQLVKRLELHQSEVNKSVSSLLESYSKNAPSGSSQVAVAAVKSAFSAANTAFENVNKAARQVANITEASVDAATSATVRAVGAASPAKKKAA